MTALRSAGTLGLILPLAAAALAGEPLQDAPTPPRISGEGVDPEVLGLLEALLADVEKAPSNPDVHAELGLAYEANTLFVPAAQCYRNVLALAPDRTEFLYRLGVMQTAMGDVEGALESMRGAAEVYKNTPVIQARLGDLYLTLGEVDAAAAAWERAIAAEEKQPQKIAWPASRVGLARARYDQGRLEEAARLLEEALQLDPGYRHAHYLLGLCYIDLGREEEGELELARGVRAWPQLPPDPHQPKLDGYSVGYHRRMMEIENVVAGGDPVTAEARLRGVLEDRPQDPLALNLLARVLQQLERTDEAVTTLRRAEELAPDLCSTKIELSIALMNRIPQVQGELASRQAGLDAASGGTITDEAREELVADIERLARELESLTQEMVGKAEAAVRLAPRLGRARYFYGVALLATAGQDQQRLQGALGELERALVYGCQEPDLFRTLGTIYARAGRMAEMVESAQAFVDSRKDDPSAWVFLAQATLTRDQFEPSAELREAALHAIGRARELAPGDFELQQLYQQFATEIENRNAAAAPGQPSVQPTVQPSVPPAGTGGDGNGGVR